MKEDVFRFKKFEVNQADCAMRINTDGVLLAAFSAQANVQRILDIGAGTGVIALMLAQRFSESRVEAVELEKDAASRAAENFRNSPFAHRMTLHSADILDFESKDRFDLVVSNPPYFVNDLKNPNAKKELARHASIDFFEKLIIKVTQLLTDKGSFWFILPLKQANDLIIKAKVLGFFPKQITTIHSDESKAAFRYLVSLTRQEEPIEWYKLPIYNSDGSYSDEYRSLLKDFFTIF